MTSSVFLLVYKDYLLELKTKSTLGGIFLYLVSTVFVCYMAFEGIVSVKEWNALFWIVMLFTSFNAILKGFIQESSERGLYYYTLVNAGQYILAKIIYNTLLLFILAFFAFGVFLLFMGNVVENTTTFLTVILLGVVGISSVLTLLSAIASKVRNNFTLVSILSFPIFLPQLIVLLRASEEAIAGAAFIEILPELSISLIISAIALVLSYILYPYIWQD